MTSIVNTGNGGCILYDPQLLSQPRYSLFAPESWVEWTPVGAAQAGRGAAWFVSDDGLNCVIRHFRRGGLLARFVQDHYLFTGQNRTRSFREWHLLSDLYQRGLPVPRPVAAGFRRQFGISYQAALITERLPDVESLAELFQSRRTQPRLWDSVGSVIAQFHNAGVWHSDLNAHNIQINAQGVWLLDFDKSAIRHGQHWQAANLARLQRSLQKIAAQHNLTLSDSDWQCLLSGYSGSVAR